MDSIENNIAINSSKSIQEIKEEFSKNLISINIFSNFIIPDEYGISNSDKLLLRKKFNSTISAVRRKVERASLAYYCGEFFLFKEDYLYQRKYVKSDITSASNVVELSIKDQLSEAKETINDYYNDCKDSEIKDILGRIEIKYDLNLVVRPFPYYRDLSLNDEIDIDINQYGNEILLQIYKQAKEQFLTKKYINNTNVIELMEKYNEFIFNDTGKLESIGRKKINLTKQELINYYKNNNITDDYEVIEELERNSLLYYYYKFKTKEAEQDPVKAIVKAKVIDGARSIYKRANKFYEMTGDKEVKEQLDKLKKYEDILEEN